MEGIRNRKLEMINQDPAEKCSFLKFFPFLDHAKNYSFISFNEENLNYVISKYVVKKLNVGCIIMVAFCGEFFL